MGTCSECGGLRKCQNPCHDNLFDQFVGDAFQGPEDVCEDCGQPASERGDCYVCNGEGEVDDED
jgi:hypothetical protein